MSQMFSPNSKGHPRLLPLFPHMQASLYPIILLPESHLFHFPYPCCELLIHSLLHYCLTDIHKMKIRSHHSSPQNSLALHHKVLQNTSLLALEQSRSFHGLIPGYLHCLVYWTPILQSVPLTCWPGGYFELMSQPFLPHLHSSWALCLECLLPAASPDKCLHVFKLNHT